MSSFGDIHGIDSARFRADWSQEERREPSRQSDKRKKRLTTAPENEIEQPDSPDDVYLEGPQGTLDISA